MADLTAPFKAAEDPSPYDLTPMVESWLRSLRARNLAQRTIHIYGHAARGFTAHLLAYTPELDAKPAPEDLFDIHREHVESYITKLLATTKPATAHQQFRSLKTFFTWLVDEEEIDRSPMRTMKPPQLGEQEVPIIPTDALKRLLKVATGKDFESRRDTAILMMFLDTGVRLSELTVRDIRHVDLDLMVFMVVGKGNKERSVPFGRATTQVLDRYFRAYQKHIGRPLRPEDPLWIGIKTKQRFTIWGVGQVVGRRAEQAGLGHIHPHQFRHTLAHMWKVGGGNEDALMRIMGWRSREMLQRYGASAADERAKIQHRDLSPGDQL